MQVLSTYFAGHFVPGNAVRDPKCQLPVILESDGKLNAGNT